MDGWMPDPGFSHDWPWALPASFQPSLHRGVRGVSPRLTKNKGPPLFLPRSSALRLSLLSLSLFLLPSFCCPFPGSCSRGPSLPGRWTLLTRQADPSYPAGGPPLPGSRQADTPYLPSGRAADSRCILLSYSEGGCSLLGRRILLTREVDTPYSGGGFWCVLA